MELVQRIAEYLAPHTKLILANNLWYYEMPASPDECVCIYEEKSNADVPAQIDAEVHKIRVGSRAMTNNKAAELCNICYRWLLTDDENYEADRDASNVTGFIKMNDGVDIFVQLSGGPICDKVDQQGRKYFYFTATIITNRR